MTYPSALDYIHIRLIPDTPQASPLIDAITLRQNTRSEYFGQLVQFSDLEQVQALSTEPDVSMQLLISPTELKTILEYVSQGNMVQYSDKAFVNELIHWIRFNRKETLASLDGSYTRCSGNPEVPCWLVQLFMEGMKPKQQVDLEARKLPRYAGVVVIASKVDD